MAKRKNTKRQTTTNCWCWHPSTTREHGGSKMNIPLLFTKSYTMCKHIKAADKTFDIVLTKCKKKTIKVMMCRWWKFLYDIFISNFTDLAISHGLFTMKEKKYTQWSLTLRENIYAFLYFQFTVHQVMVATVKRSK
jgi:hypothetical protein